MRDYSAQERARARAKGRTMGSDAEIIMPLYRLALSHVDNERIADWMAVHGLRYSNQLVKRTLKAADRADLIDYLIKEEDIKIGDTVKSRNTARVGTVIGIHTDGDTIDVRWDAGGTQPLSKEGVFKLRSKMIDDFSKVHTHIKDPYVDVYDEKREFSRPEDKQPGKNGKFGY